MQKVKLIVAAAGLIALIMGWGTAVSAEDEMCVPMGDITLSSLAPHAERADVTFPHAIHFTYNCEKCHHTWDRKTAIVSCTTSGCHDLAALPKDAEGRITRDPEIQIRYFKNAYHSLCIGCHKEIKQRNEKIETMQLANGGKVVPTGPTGCIKCHPMDEQQ